MDVYHAADVNNLEIALETTTGGVYNVKEFGATGNGTTDDSVAIKAAATALANSAVANPSATSDGRVLAQGTLYFPAGRYKVTDPTAMIVNNATVGRGYAIVGAGRYATEILFTPAAGADAYLLNNTGTGWMHLTVRDIAFTGETTNACFSWTDSTNAQRDFVYERCTFTGFKYGFRNTGADNYDTFTFHHCGCFGTWTSFFWVEGSDNAVCHWFGDHTWEVAAGDFVTLTKGGNLNVVNGSLVQTGAGTLFKLLGTAHNDGTQHLLVQGVRVELRVTSAQLLYSEWGGGAVVFEAVDAGAYQSLVTSTINTVFNGVSSSLPTVTCNGCTFQGQHQYTFGNDSYLRPQQVRYVDCEFPNYANPADAFVFADGTAGGIIGGKAVVHLLGCRGTGATAIVLDTDANWQVAARGSTTRKVVSVKYAYGTNPFSAGSEQVVLPKNSVVVGARLYAPAFGTSTSTTWDLKFQTTEATPTVLLDASPGTQLQLGFNESADLWFVCDTDAKRTINLVSNAALDQTTTAFVGILEYIG